MFFSHLKNKMTACLKNSKVGIFEKFSARGGYTKNTPPPYPLFPLPAQK